MNPARIAALFRELADAFDEGAAAEERPRTKQPRPRPVDRPPGQSDDIAQARAKRMLLRHAIKGKT